MKRTVFLILLIVFCISCGSKDKFKGEIKIHFENISNKEEYKKIIETRLERLNVKKSAITDIPNGFSIELQTSDPELVLKMLQLNDQLGFWETYENEEIYGSLDNLNTLIKTRLENDSTIDSTAKQFPLYSKLQLNMYEDMNQHHLAKGSIIGFAKPEDTANVHSMLRTGFKEHLFPMKIVFMWGDVNEKSVFPLHALKKDDFTNGPFMQNGVVESSKIKKNDMGNQVLLLNLTKEGRRTFESYTKKNVDKQIAITFSSMVIVSPVVNGPIAGGKVEITGPNTKFLRLLEYASKMPVYPTKPTIVSHHFELIK